MKVQLMRTALASVFIVWASTAWSSEKVASNQPDSGAATEMTSTSDSQKMSSEKGGMKQKMHQMMGKGMDKPGKQQMTGPGGKKKSDIVSPEEKKRHRAYGGVYALMGPFHRWMGCLISHQTCFNLTPVQLERMDDAVTRHLMSVTRSQAEARALKLDLKHALRKEKIELNTVEGLVQKLTHQESDMLMEGIKLYTEVLNTLTADQRMKVREIIGGPFPPPWEDMAFYSCTPSFQ
jgi:hypothetical protein